MRQAFVLTISLFILSFGFGQTVIFSEDFESGTPSSEWQVFFTDEEPIEAVAMSSAPAPLATGGNYVGRIMDADASYTGAAMAVAGDTTLANYAIQADVYCYVNNSGGSAYTGLAVYADSTRGGSQSSTFYYKLVADFDASNRFRLYNNQLNSSTFQYTFHHSIDATGYYTTDAWHTMRIEVTTVDSSTTQFVLYFDGLPLGDPVYEDTSVDVRGSGQFGVYAFQMGSGIAGYFDNIVVTDLSTVGISNEALIPKTFLLRQNYPNPFNPTTTIAFDLFKDGYTTLKIYDINGAYINTLIQDNLASDSYRILWNGSDVSGRQVPSGVYIYRLVQGNVSQQNKMMFIK